MTSIDDLMRRKARALYCDSTNDIEIDEDAKIGIAENGTWVAAWVWVPDETEEAA